METRQRVGWQVAGRWGLAAVWCVATAVAPQATAAPVAGWVQQIVARSGVGSLSVPTLNTGWLAYADAGIDNVPHAPGVYLRSVNGVTTQVAGESSAPAVGALVFPGSLTAPASVSVDEAGGVTFLAQAQGGPLRPAGPALFSAAAPEAQVLALPSITPVLGGAEVVTVVGEPSRSFGLTTFSGMGSTSGEALFAVDEYRGPEVVVRLGDTAPSTLLSNYDVSFKGFGRFAANDWNDRRLTAGWDLAFLADTRVTRPGYSGTSQGIFVATGLDTLQVVAERGTPVPQGAQDEWFEFFFYSPSIADGRVAYTATGRQGTQGVYMNRAGEAPIRIADNRMQAPGGFGEFASFGGWVDVEGDSVLFTATNRAGQSGIFLGNENGISLVFDEDDYERLLPGATQWSAPELGLHALSGNQVAFRISAGFGPPDGFDAIVLATAVFVPTPGSAVLVLLGLGLLVTSRRRPGVRGR